MTITAQLIINTYRAKGKKACGDDGYPFAAGATAQMIAFAWNKMTPKQRDEFFPTLAEGIIQEIEI